MFARIEILRQRRWRLKFEKAASLATKKVRNFPGDRQRSMLSGESWDKGDRDENTCEFVCDGGDIDGGWGCSGAAGGTSGSGTSGQFGPGHVAGGESGERIRESGSGAIREEHGGGSRGHAGGEICVQAVAGDEFVWAPDDAHRAIEQYVLREDFGAGGARREDRGNGCEGQAGGGDERFLCVLHGSAGESGRFETGGAIHVLRQPADLARGRP